MNTKELHQQTIKGLIQTTVNRTHLDLERRGLIAEGTTVDWNQIRSLDREINLLFTHGMTSRREAQSIRNLIVEVRTRAITTYQGIPNTEDFEVALAKGIQVYSRHIRDNNIRPPNNFAGFQQTLEEQFHWGILELHQRNFQLKPRLTRYRNYRRQVATIIAQFFRDNGANLIFDRLLRAAQQDCCWCLFNYKKLPLYRTTLRDYIEDIYIQADQELQRQGLDIPIAELVQNLETYIANQCTYLHFNLENNAAEVITAVRQRQLARRRIMALNQQGLQDVLNGVLGQHGLNINQILTAVQQAQQATTQALNALPGAGGPREVSIIKVPDFWGKDEEDPYEWVDQFKHAAAANQWQGEARLLNIAKGYLKGAAADWVREATTVGVNRQIVYWDNVNQQPTSLAPRLLEKFAPETRQNKWYQELMTLRQSSTETVDQYALKFQRLLRKVNGNGNLVPAALQVRMFLYGLIPVLTPLVATDNPANLAAAIERARTVETGYNYAPAKAPVPFGNVNTVAGQEVDELTKRIEQLSLNYATLASALVIQPSQGGNRPNRNNYQQNQRTRQQRPTWQGNDRRCYNCDKPGHLARNCTAPKRMQRRTRFNTTRDVHYMDFQDEKEEPEPLFEEEYEEESEVYQYEQEAYPAMRSGRQYIPRRKQPVVDELEKLRRNTEYNANTSRPNHDRTTISGPKINPKMVPAPIESLTEFNVAEYLQNLSSGLSVGQAAHLLPKYRAGMQRAVRRSQSKSTNEKEANLVDSDENEATTAAKVTLRVNGKVQTAIVDSGAATSIITKALLDRLGLSIDRPSKLIVVTANGAQTKSLGIVSQVPIMIEKTSIPTSFQVLESRDEILILGNEWLRKNQAVMDWKQSLLTIQGEHKTSRIHVTFTRTCKVDAWEDSDSEEENSDEEANIYYSDLEYSSDDSLDYNPWTTEQGNPAIYLAEKEQTNEQNQEWNLQKDMHVGPLDYHQQNTFLQMIEEDSDICAASQLDIGRTNILQHEINTSNHLPVAKQAYKANPIKKDFIEKEIDEMEQRGLIRKSKSPWASPIVVVEKKDSAKRLCIDYRGLNKITKIDRYPLPRIDELLESFRTANWFTTLDLASGYWQVEMREEDKEKTAFISHKGLYEFNVMPFGLCNAPSTFQRLMNYILQKFLGKFVAVYLDDIIIYSTTFEQHIDHIHQVFQALRNATLKIKLKKCYFCFPNITFLGHVVGRNGIAPDPAKVEKIKNFPRPTTLKELRGALGLFSYYRKFVRDFSKIAKPMLNLLKQDVPFLWEEQQQTSFEELKQRLMEAPILQYPDFTKPFVLYTDASGTGLGAVLSQIDEEKRERVIAYASRSLNKAECNYGITDQECLAIVWAVKHFEPYLGLLPFRVITDHSALKFLQTAEMPTGRRARWIMYLQQFKFEITYRPGKENKNADALSRITETYCFYIGDENQEGEGSVGTKNFENTYQFINLTPQDLEEDYEGDSEDNISSNDGSISQMMNDIRKDMKELEQLKEKREERWKRTEVNRQKCLEVSHKLIDPEKRKQLRLVSNHSDDEVSERSTTYQYHQDTYTYEPSQFGRLDEWNDEILLPTERQEPNEPSQERQEPAENENGWGPEYYNNDNEWYNPIDETTNENWGLPDLSSEAEQHVEEVWGQYTVAWTYSQNEITTLVNEITETKWVIAGQPLRKSKWKCDDNCDYENHHLHTYCNICQRRIDHQERLNHNCQFGLGLGQIHPDMNPNYLCNYVFWDEPGLTPEFNMEELEEHNHEDRYSQDIEEIRKINQRHQSELNGGGTSRIPFEEPLEVNHHGRRFQPY